MPSASTPRPVGIAESVPVAGSSLFGDGGLAPAVADRRSRAEAAQLHGAAA